MFDATPVKEAYISQLFKFTKTHANLHHCEDCNLLILH